MKPISIEITIGEAVDRLTIAQVKLDRLKDDAKLKKAREEISELSDAIASCGIGLSAIEEHRKEMYQVNDLVFALIDRCTTIERSGTFTEEYIATSYAVKRVNDSRYQIKAKINQIFGQETNEVKSHL